MAIPGTQWVEVPGFASDIAVATDGSVVYHIGRGGEIYLWDGAGGWQFTGQVTSQPEALAAGPAGEVAFFGLHKRLFTWAPDGTRHERPGVGQDLGFCADGSIWMCHEDTALYAHRGIFVLDPGAPRIARIQGRARRISGGGQRTPWSIGLDDERPYFYTGDPNSAWNSVDGIATDIAASEDGHVWHLGDNRQLYYREGNRWLQAPGLAAKISVGRGGLPWVVTAEGQIFRRV